MPTLEVLSRTQRIVVLPNTSVSIVKVGPTGPPGPPGPVGPPGSAIVSGLYVPVDGPPTTIETTINFLLSPKINGELLSALFLLLDGGPTTVATPIDFTTAPTVNGEPLAPDIPEGTFVPVDGAPTTVDTEIDFTTAPTVNGSAIGGSSIAPELIEASLGADVPMVTNTYVLLLSITLTPGTWRVGANLLWQNIGGWVTAKTHVGATVHGSAEGYNSANGGGLSFSLPLRRIVVPAGTTQTLSLSAGTDSGSGTFKHKAILNVFNTGTEGTMTRLWAIREAA